MHNSALFNRSKEMGLAIIGLYKLLTSREREWILSKQLLRSGTNPGAMVHEAFFAESGKDFTHKLKIALKEAHETQYWLILLYESDYIRKEEYLYNVDLVIQVKKLLVTSIRTRERNLNKERK
ncbi:MAG: four helix bundle protein [Bacteroidota bacterium]